MEMAVDPLCFLFAACFSPQPLSPSAPHLPLGSLLVVIATTTVFQALGQHQSTGYLYANQKRHCLLGVALHGAQCWLRERSTAGSRLPVASWLGALVRETACMMLCGRLARALQELRTQRGVE